MGDIIQAVVRAVMTAPESWSMTARICVVAIVAAIPATVWIYLRTRRA